MCESNLKDAVEIEVGGAVRAAVTRRGRLFFLGRADNGGPGDAGRHRQGRRKRRPEDLAHLVGELVVARGVDVLVGRVELVRVLDELG